MGLVRLRCPVRHVVGRVEIKPGKKGAGKLVISYSNHEHLDDLLSKFNR
jgi:hypothetical protein